MSLITNKRAKELESEINDMEKMLKSPVGDRHIGDKAEFMGEVRKRKDELRAFAPRELKGAKANEAYAIAKRLRSYIQKGMPSSRDYFRRYPKEKDKDGNVIIPDHNEKRDFERAVEQQVAFQSNPRMQKAITIYKNLMARIDPSDPTVRNIEMLRR